MEQNKHCVECPSGHSTQTSPTSNTAAKVHELNVSFGWDSERQVFFNGLSKIGRPLLTIILEIGIQFYTF